MKPAAPFENVKTVLVVLSSQAQAFDMPALRNFITHAYAGTAVFFYSTSGDAMGAEAPSQVDLVIDFTPPNARQARFFAYSMKKRSRFTVGRNVGWFYRRKNFDRVYDEKDSAIASATPTDYIQKETWAQRNVLELAGVPVIRQGGVGQDRGKDIALDLPPLHQR
jgi:hypothetical protein